MESAELQSTVPTCNKQAYFVTPPDSTLQAANVQVFLYPYMTESSRR